MKEEWKKIEEYPDYMVSNLGNVKSLKFGKEKLLKQGVDNHNYCCVVLCKEGKEKTFKVHRLVAQAFLPNPDNLPQVNHKDENKQNNCVSNLEYCDAKYNMNYGLRNEKASKAISIAKSKPILQFNKQGTKILGKWKSATQVEKELGIEQSNICRCCNGKLKSCGGFKWKYLQDFLIEEKKAS